MDVLRLQARWQRCHFYAEHKGVSKQAARREVKEHYAPGYKAPKYGSIAREFESRYRASKERHEEPTVATIDPELLWRFDVDWSYYAEEHGDQPDVAYMLDRGFTPGDLDDWGIGYDADSQRITIPVCDPDGNLVGFKGRAWRKNARPKYLVLGDKGERQRYGFPTYDKSLVVFGLDRCGSARPVARARGGRDRRDQPVGHGHPGDLLRWLHDVRGAGAADPRVLRRGGPVL